MTARPFLGFSSSPQHRQQEEPPWRKRREPTDRPQDFSRIEEIRSVAGRSDADGPLRKVAVCAVVTNPFADRGYVEDLSELVEASDEIGTLLGEQGVHLLGAAPQSYGEGGVVGRGGEQEHINAALTSTFGDALRNAVRGGKAWITSVTKAGAPGTTIDVPLAYKDEIRVRSHYDAVTVHLADASHPDELVVIAAVANRGHLNARVGGLTVAGVAGYDSREASPARLSSTWRTRWMRAAADLLEAELDQVARLITSEMGKPVTQSRAEVAKSVHTMRYYADHGQPFLSGRSLDDPSVVGASAAGTRFDPLGVVPAVMPWNYPIWQVVRFAAPVLMAGNAAVLKHASNVPQAAVYLGALFTRAGFPEGSFGTLLIGSSRVAGVIRDPRITAVTLTGSEGTGRAVAATAGDVLKKVVLELGGSDAFIVMPSADIDAAARSAVQARTLNNGQACVNAKRFIVHEDVYDEFADRFAAGLTSLIVGDPADPSTDIGPLATEAGRSDVEELVEDARAGGARIVVGGRRPGQVPGWFYAPTLIAGITETMRLFAEEAFGPVASLYRVVSLTDALAVANGIGLGLGAAFWSADQDEIDLAVRALESGAVFVNGIATPYAELPFGGVKRSGYGRELSREGIREFCNLKTVWVA